MADEKKIDLNQPVSWLDKIGKEREPESEKAPDETQNVVESEKVEKEEEPAEISEREASKVTFSRFLNVKERAMEAERDAAYWKAMAERNRELGEPRADVVDDEAPSYWTKLYGDTPEAGEAWKIQRQMNEDLVLRARREAQEALEEQREQEAENLNVNLETIDDHLDSVSAVAGHELTDAEQSAVLDIIDDYTPKDADGNYIGAILEPDKAWEIYEFKQERIRHPKQMARDNVASISGSRSQGETDQQIIAERDKAFNPMDWQAYKRRL